MIEQPPASAYCDVHSGFVDEGRTHPIGGDPRYRICDGCQEERQRAQRLRESYCPTCHYLMSFHASSRCPSELEARAAAGDR